MQLFNLSLEKQHIAVASIAAFMVIFLVMNIDQNVQITLNHSNLTSSVSLTVSPTFDLVNGGSVLTENTPPTEPRHNGNLSDMVSSESANTKEENNKNSDLKFLVDTPFCKIENYSAFDISLKFIVGEPKFIHCDHFNSYSYVQNNTLYVQWNPLAKSILPEQLSYCQVWPIVRPITPHTTHYSWNYIEPNTMFRKSTELKHDFILVKCFNSNDKIVYQNFHSNVQEKENIEKLRSKKFSEWKSKLPNVIEHPSVLIIGTDSVSRLNAVRFLPKTRAYLTHQLDGVEMLGYTKVGDNTFPNIVPMLTGKTVEELPWTKQEPTVFDRYPFAWKNYSENGYRTLFLEDQPYGAIFDYMKPGFHETPTDYYNRHYHLAMDREQELWYNEHTCLVNKSQTDIVLDYTLDFLKVFRSRPYFGFVFITRLTHDVLEQTATVDDIYAQFLRTCDESNLLNNTVLIFMSDHGIRFGPIRKTFIGKMEERLPMMFVVFPKWFKKKYPSIQQNLKHNSRLLTTPFDVHETLMELLYFGEPKNTKSEKSQRGYSLVKRIPKSRNCDVAGIEEHWCTCASQEEVSVRTNSVKKAAEFLVADINMKLYAQWDRCEKLEIEKINSAYRVKQANKALEALVVSYQLTITLTPGGGLFEGTVKYSSRGPSYSINGDISRINAYGHEVRCDVDYHLEKFCYCKNNTNIAKFS